MAKFTDKEGKAQSALNIVQREFFKILFFCFSFPPPVLR